MELEPSAGGTALNATTDADGAFAFVDVEIGGASRTYDMRVLAAGYGAYEVANDAYAADETYLTSVELSDTLQYYDETDVSIDSATTEATSGVDAYGSHSRVPPVIKVALFKRDAACGRDASSAYAARWYPWRFYVLHTATAEIDTRWDQVSWRGVVSAIQNYAWYQRLLGQKGFGFGRYADVNNTTDYQCFKPHKKVPTSWADRLVSVVDERLLDSSNNVKITQYRAGTYACTESLYPANGNKLSQNGARARAQSNTTSCGGAEGWRDIVHYYYTGQLDLGSAPTAPDISYKKVSNGVRLEFGGAAYRFDLQRYTFVDGAYYWQRIYNRGWSWKSRSVPKAYTYQTNGCYSYRVRGSNPSGYSPYSNYSGGNSICPGS